MIDFDDISRELSDALAMLDGAEFPETENYLGSLQDEDGDVTAPPYEIASRLLGMDRPQPFPPFMVELITLLYEAEIAEGNSDAMTSLGAQYYGGNRGFEQSYEKAVDLYNMAAALGNRIAQENLGYCYYYGRVGAPDYEKAFRYFAMGAFDGMPVSLYKIGDMYLHGLYVDRDEQEAFDLYMNCIRSLTPQTEGRVAGPVYLRLGRLFLNGVGTDPDPKSALICFQKAEAFLYDMVAEGDHMYLDSLRDAVAGQSAARAKLAERLDASRP